MNRKAIMALLLFLFIKAPFVLFADNIETIISADQILVDKDGVLQASGNVKVRRGNVFIRSEAMIVDEKRNEILKSIPECPVEESKPKRPKTSYVLFSMEERQKISKEFPELKLGDISKKCGEAWKNLSEEEKNIWKEKASAQTCV